MQGAVFPDKIALATKTSEKNTAALATSSERLFSTSPLLLQQLNLDITLCLRDSLALLQRAFHRATVHWSVFHWYVGRLRLYEAGIYLKAVCPRRTEQAKASTHRLLLFLADNLNHAQILNTVDI